MNWLRYIFLSLFLSTMFAAYGQDPELEGKLEEGIMNETVVEEAGTENTVAG